VSFEDNLGELEPSDCVRLLVSGSSLLVGGFHKYDGVGIRHQSTGLLQCAVLRHPRRSDAPPPLDPARCRSVGDGHSTMRLHLACSPPTALASNATAAARQVQGATLVH